MCNPICSSSLSVSSKRSAPSQTSEGSPVTTIATETFAKKARTMTQETPRSLENLTITNPSYYVSRFKDLVGSSNEISEEASGVLSEAVSEHFGEVVLNELLETFMLGKSSTSQNINMAKALFLFGQEHRIRLRLQLVDALRAIGFGSTLFPHLTIKPSLPPEQYRSFVWYSSEINCLFPTEQSFPTLIETLRTDKTIAGLKIGCIKEGVGQATLEENSEKETLPLTNEQLPLLLQTLTECRQLSRLKIEGSPVNDTSAAMSLADHIRQTTSLTYFNLNYTYIEIEGVTEIFRAMSVNSSITTLRIRAFDGYRDAEKPTKIAYREAFANMLRMNTTLSALCLTDPDYIATNKVLAANINASSSLTSLTLCESYRHEELLQALQHNTTLTELNNGDLNVTPDILGNLVRLIDVNTTLRAIDLHSPKVIAPDNEEGFSDEDGESLANALVKNPTLTSLNIKNIDMSDATAMRMLMGLRGNTTLQSLHFYQRKEYNENDPVVREIEELFRYNTTLTNLSYITRPVPDVLGPIRVLGPRLVYVYVPEDHPARVNREYPSVTRLTGIAKANAAKRETSLFQILFEKYMLQVT